MKKILYILILALLIPFIGESQEGVLRLSLSEAIDMASQQSPDALIARHKFRQSYWEYRTFRAQYMPRLTFTGTLPAYSNSLTKYTNQLGQTQYIKENNLQMVGGMALSKTIGLTGGEIYVSSRLERLDDFTDSTTTSYLSHPVTIGINQKIFGYNEHKWARKIDPIKYEEAKRTFLEDMETVALNASNYFFNLLISESKQRIAKMNVASYDTLYRIAKGRYNMGTISENELLQLELNLLRSKTELQSAKIDVENYLFRLKSFLRIKGSDSINLVPPGDVPTFKVESKKAIELARTNRASSLGFERRLMEAQRDVYQARTDNRFSATLNAEYGLSRKAFDLDEAYKSPDQSTTASLGVVIPILDWGLARGRIKMAESKQELIQTSVEQERIDFDQEVFLQVVQFNMMSDQMVIAAKSDTIASKSFLVAKARYMIGKISVTDLNIAQKEKDDARNSYFSQLQTYWRNYFTLRKLTLFDFEKNRMLEFKPDDVL